MSVWIFRNVDQNTQCWLDALQWITVESVMIFFFHPCVHKRVKGDPWWRSGVLYMCCLNKSTISIPFTYVQSVSVCCVCVFPGLLVYVAMLVGALVWGGLCDKMGRRKCLIYVLSIDLLFSFLSCFAQGYGFFLFFRFCSGFGWDTFILMFTFTGFKWSC